MLESRLEAHFRSAVRRAGGRSYKLAPTTAGLPDRLVALAGQLHLVELKRDAGSLSAVQLIRHRQLAEQGIPVATLYGRDDVDAWIADPCNTARWSGDRG